MSVIDFQGIAEPPLLASIPWTLLLDSRVVACEDGVTLQRHFRVLTKFAHVESRLSGRKRQKEVVFYTPVILCDRRPCSTSVAVGLSVKELLTATTSLIKSHLSVILLPSLPPESSSIYATVVY